MSCKWSDNERLILMRLYKFYGTPLWNTDYPSDAETKMQAWEKITEEMKKRGFKVEMQQVRTQTNYIRDRYKQELIRIKSNNSFYKPTQTWFSFVDSFLKPYINTSQQLLAPKAEPEESVSRKRKSSPPPDDKDRPTADSFALFGEYVAMELRSYPTKIKAMEAQRKIQDVLIMDQTALLEGQGSSQMGDYSPTL